MRLPLPAAAFGAAFAAGLPALLVLLSSPPASAAPVPPVAAGTSWAFALPGGGPRLEIDPRVGGRIASLKLGTAELLYVDRSDVHLWGATFWSAPQSAWSWPPPDALDRAPYAGGPQGSQLVLASPADAATGFAFGKRFSADDADTSLTLAFTIRNASATARRAAPWLVTRVLPGGLTFFPKGEGAGRGDLVPLLTESGGWLWFEYPSAPLPGQFPKYFGDGAGGWMAHVDKDGLLLLELFPDIAPAQAAPEEAEIEIFADPARRYIEVEHQGAYVPLAPGDSLAWTTRWLLRRLPADIPRKAGDPKLVAYVTSLARRGSATLRDSRGAATPQVTRLRPSATPRFPAPVAPVDAAGRAHPPNTR